MKVVGIENKKGVMNKDGEAIPYDVNYIYCTEQAPNVIGGVRCHAFKINKKVVFDGFSKLDELLGKNVYVATGYSELYGTYVKEVVLLNKT